MCVESKIVTSIENLMEAIKQYELACQEGNIEAGYDKYDDSAARELMKTLHLQHIRVNLAWSRRITDEDTDNLA